MRRSIKRSMKTSRFQAWVPSVARLSLVGASTVLSLMGALDPAQAHGDVKGNGLMPDTKGALGPELRIDRSASCGCCTQWGSHIASAEFRINDQIREDMDLVKQQRGVRSALASCHTAVVEGYVIEGHVPASAIQRLLAERPNIRGLAVPGMPVGSPGMEVKGVQAESYEVLAIEHDGSSSVFARY